MWVDAAARGTGVADALIDTAVDQARRSGFTTMILWVVVGNERAARCYQRHGFALTGTEEWRERDGATEAEMSRDLAV